MELSDIKILLEKYWRGDTSLEEETRLKDFFAENDDVPEELLADKYLFLSYQREAPALDEDLVSAINFQAQRKVVPLWKKVLKYAAVIVPLVCIGYIVIQNNKPDTAIRETIKDDKDKIKEATTALHMVAVNMRDGLENLNALDVLKDVGNELDQNNK